MERENIIGYIVRGKCSITYCCRTIYLSANSTFIKETQETQKNKLHTSKLKKQKISPAAWQNPVTLFFLAILNYHHFLGYLGPEN